MASRRGIQTTRADSNGTPQSRKAIKTRPMKVKRNPNQLLIYQTSTKVLHFCTLTIGFLLEWEPQFGSFICIGGLFFCF